MKQKQKPTEEKEKKMEEKAYIGGFDPKTAGNDVMKFWKSAFSATYESAVLVQDLNVKILKDMIEAGKGVQTDVAKIADLFIANAKKAREDYKKVFDDGFTKMTEIYSVK